MRPMIFFTLILILAGCESPRQQCLNAATRDLANVRELIKETEATIARGYALEKETFPTLTYGFCTGKQNVAGCFQNRLQSRAIPVAVDLTAERAKLAELKRKERELTRRAGTTIAACPAS